MRKYYVGVLHSAQNRELDDASFTGTRNQIRLARDCAAAVKEDDSLTEKQRKEAEELIRKLILIENNLYRVRELPVEILLTMPIEKLEKVLTQNGES